MNQQREQKWTEPLQVISILEAPTSNTLLSGLFSFWDEAIWFTPEDDHCPDWTPAAAVLEVDEALDFASAFLEKWCADEVRIDRVGDAFHETIYSCDGWNEKDRGDCLFISKATKRKISYTHVLCSLLLLQVDRAARKIVSGDALASIPFLADAAKLMMEIRTEVDEQGDRQELAELAKKRHSRDPRQAEKLFIKSCFEDWCGAPARYASSAAFARDMLDKCEHLTSQKKIEDWVREWRRDQKGGRNVPSRTLPAQ